MHGGDCRGGRLHPVRPAHWADSLRPKLVFLLAAWRDYNGPMDDEFWKRHLEETERLARLADPLREFKSQSMRAQEQLAAMLRDPMDEFRDQIKAMAEPLSQVPAWLKDYNRHEEQLRALTQPLVDVNAQIQALMPQDSIKKQIEALLKPFNDAGAWFKAYQAEEEARRQQWSTLFDDFARQLEGLPDEIRAQLAALMDRGWCLDPEMPHTWGRDLIEAIELGEEDEVQQWLMAYFRQRLDRIEQSLVQRHPGRVALLADAFQAHREGRYGLSIPVMLSQADGVIHDRHQRQLYSKNAGTNLQGVLAKLPDDGMRAMVVAAFYVDTPLIRKTHQLPPGFDGLNRHAVLHGTDPNYGTEVNGLRAVSILNLASYLVTEEADATAE